MLLRRLSSLLATFSTSGGSPIFFSRSPQLVELLLLFPELAQLLLDGLELLAQVVLALGLGHLALDLRIDLAGKLEDLALAVEELEDELHPLLEVHRLQDLLLLLDGNVDVGGDQSARWPGWVMLSTSSVAAAGSSGIISMTSRASFFRFMPSASISTSSKVDLSSTGSMRALR